MCLKCEKTYNPLTIFNRYCSKSAGIRVPIGVSDFSATVDLNDDSPFSTFLVSRHPLEVLLYEFARKMHDLTAPLDTREGSMTKILHARNEPQIYDPVYPSWAFTPNVEGRIGSALRSLLHVRCEDYRLRTYWGFISGESHARLFGGPSNMIPLLQVFNSRTLMSGGLVLVRSNFRLQLWQWYIDNL
ncbi:hypothetical protein BDP27DRAFT_1405368 [Rhodocollybia butyracea]|uniref:Uncharacterized protein n=1 Tax=Rhodocollybia butyracea TaxID=206335 RepID=A0A9P5U3A0_9AGAR|nr:hypothetical protein BDP27DRAFT_1405368 [Rhodocollybia butyracea]